MAASGPTVGMHDKVSEMPRTITIGTATAFHNRCAFKYEMHHVGGGKDYGFYICRTTTETGLPGEHLFIVSDGEYWYACEGKLVADELSIRQACFRTSANYWTRTSHKWEMNGQRSTDADCKWADGKWQTGQWGGKLTCETR